MADAASSLDRIERALDRIRAAAEARDEEAAELARRHRTLRQRVEAAVASLDALGTPKEG